MSKAYARMISFSYLRLPYPPPPRFDIVLAFESSAQALPGDVARIMDFKDLTLYIKKLDLERVGLDSLQQLIQTLILTDKFLDGYQLDLVTFKYCRHEIRMLDSNKTVCILVRFNLYSPQIKFDNSIGYYDYLVNLDGKFLDEFFVFNQEANN